MEVVYKDDTNLERLYFTDLDVRDSFRIVGAKAIYVKIIIEAKTMRDLHVANGISYVFIPHDVYAQMELETGKVFRPTESEVELIEVVTEIGVEKPDIYKKVDYRSNLNQSCGNDTPF